AHVVLTQDWHTPGHASFASTYPGKKPFETISLGYGTQVLWPDHCIQGTADAELVKELKIPHAELIIRKGYRKPIDSYSAFYEAAHRDRARPIPRLGGRRDDGAVAAPPGKDEAPVPDVDRGVMKPIEEDDVARLERLPRDRRAVPELLRRVVGKRDAHVRVDVQHEAGAVEAVRARAAPRVRRAEMRPRYGDDSPGARRGGLRLPALG